LALLKRYASAGADGSVIDKSKLSGDLWVRMVWAPEASTDPDDRPIALVADRRRVWLSAIALVLAVVVAIVLILVRASTGLILPFLVVLFLGYRYSLGARTGYYEVRGDGSLGDFLGRQIPAAIKGMRPTKQ
jgi:hypothetical protein